MDDEELQNGGIRADEYFRGRAIHTFPICVDRGNELDVFEVVGVVIVVLC